MGQADKGPPGGLCSRLRSEAPVSHSFAADAGQTPPFSSFLPISQPSACSSPGSDAARPQCRAAPAAPHLLLTKPLPIFRAPEVIQAHPGQTAWLPGGTCSGSWQQCSRGDAAGKRGFGWEAPSLGLWDAFGFSGWCGQTDTRHVGVRIPTWSSKGRTLPFLSSCPGAERVRWRNGGV